MPYKIKYHPKFEKAYRKIIDEALKNQTNDVLSNILDNPQSFENLKGNWAGFKSVHFHRSPEYRILFAVYQCRLKNKKTGEFYCDKDQHDDETESPILQNCEGLIYLIMLGTREEFNNLYKTSKKVIKNYRL